MTNSERRLGPAKLQFAHLMVRRGRDFLIPLRSSRVAGASLTIYNAQSPLARFRMRLLRTAISLGATAAVGPTVTLQAEDDRVADSDLTIFDYLRDALGRDDIDFAISLGTPGAHRKPVVQVMSADGTLLGYAKVGWSAVTNRLVEHECQVLRRLGAESFQTFDLPNVLHHGWCGDRHLCIQSGPRGQRMPAPRRPQTQHLECLQEIASLAPRPLRLTESPLWCKLQKRLSSVPSPYFRHVLEQGMSALCVRFGESTILHHPSHGDFAPWNMYLVGKKLFLFDWEYSEASMPAGWDLIHFLVQSAWLLGRRSPGSIYRAFRRGGAFTAPLKQHLRQLGVPSDICMPLLLCYLLDRLSFYAKEEPENLPTLQFLATLTNLAVLGGDGNGD